MGRHLEARIKGQDGQVLTAQVPRGPGWTRHLRFGVGRNREVAQVTSAVESLAAQSNLRSAGTVVPFSRVEIFDVREGHRPRRLRKRLPFGGWGILVNRLHNRHVRLAKRELERLSGTNKRGKNNPLRAAVQQERQAVRAIEHAQRRKKPKVFLLDGINDVVNRMYGVSAGLVARIAEGNPVRLARRQLNPGQTRRSINGQLRGMLLQAADEHLDPLNRIHSPLDPLVQQLQRFQGGLTGELLSEFTGDLPFDLPRVIELLVDANILTSRDVQRNRVRAGRSVVALDRYGDLLERVKSMPGERGAFLRFVLAGAGLAEGAKDRRMQEGYVAGLRKADALLSLRPDQLSATARAHQQVVAEEFLSAYTAQPPRLEALSHRVAEILSGRRVAQRIVDRMPGRARDLAQRIADIGDQRDPRPEVHAATEAYGGKPLSVRDQVNAIRANIDAVLALDSLKPAERLLWERAKASAEQFAQMEAKAQAIVASTVPAAPAT